MWYVDSKVQRITLFILLALYAWVGKDGTP
jgi:hypothetical protein